MTDDQITDLKEFLETLIIQRTSGLVSNERFDDAIKDLASKEDIARLEKELAEIKAAINETVIPYIEEVDAQVQKHEKILHKLKIA